jgi:hypothetical protein
VHRFATDREALDFLAGRIASQAKRENVPLSDVERKMLYFSEISWTLPDMATVSAEFDQNYNQDEYERKIGQLIAGITANHHGQNEQEEEKWDAAVIKLSEGDHYIQVLLKVAASVRNGPPVAHGFIPSFDAPAIRPPHDRLKLWLTAVLVFLTLAGLAFLKAKLFGN